jgi:FMNH2-dependent dimethyl sulfone monooxygenase
MPAASAIGPARPVAQAPEQWVNSGGNNVTLSKMSDEAEMDFMLPIALWIVECGPRDFHGGVLEARTWAAGLLALTKSITIFATIHAAANHHAIFAKQIATIDCIGKGRAGLNIVAGWKKPEYEALGPTCPMITNPARVCHLTKVSQSADGTPAVAWAKA